MPCYQAAFSELFRSLVSRDRCSGWDTDATRCSFGAPSVAVSPLFSTRVFRYFQRNLFILCRVRLNRGEGRLGVGSEFFPFSTPKSLSKRAFDVSNYAPIGDNSTQRTGIRESFECFWRGMEASRRPSGKVGFRAAIAVAGGIKQCSKKNVHALARRYQSPFFVGNAAKTRTDTCGPGLGQRLRGGSECSVLAGGGRLRSPE